MEEGLLLLEQGFWQREEGEHLVLCLSAVRGGVSQGLRKAEQMSLVFINLMEIAHYLISW